MVTPYYQDGAVTLYLGDCREVLPWLEPADHVITDPPYFRDVYIRLKNHHKTRERGRTKAGHSFTRSNALVVMGAGAIGHAEESLTAVVQACAAAKRWSIVFSDVENTHVWREALTDAGLDYVRTGVWSKPDYTPQISGDRPAQSYEVCTIAHAKGRKRWNGGGLGCVWHHGTARGANRPVGHPCPKPLPLMRELVSLFTDPGELVLDPFGGSGTTAVAAKELGRRCVLVEREERYAEVAAKRIEAVDRQGVLRLAPKAEQLPLGGDS